MFMRGEVTDGRTDRQSHRIEEMGLGLLRLNMLSCATAAAGLVLLTLPA